MSCTDRVIAYLLEQYIDPTTSNRIDESASSGSEVSREFVREVQAFYQCVAETCQAVRFTDRPSCQPLHRAIGLITQTFHTPQVKTFKTNEMCTLCMGSGTDILMQYGTQHFKIHIDHLRPILAFWTVRHFHHIVVQMTMRWKATRFNNTPNTLLERQHLKMIPQTVIQRIRWTFERALQDIRKEYGIVQNG